MADTLNAAAPARIELVLISHTNVGKTTLARTLLGQDVGEVRDAAHVTQDSASHRLLGTPEGDELILWDTPGLGDSARLVRRLAGASNPIGWFLSQVWDRWTDRPFYLSQQAMRATREHADVVLYPVNATEAPAGPDRLPSYLRRVLTLSLTVRGFIQDEFLPTHHADFLRDMTGWVRDGSVRYREDVVNGLENAPAAFRGLLAGRNFGKLLVRVGEDA